MHDLLRPLIGNLRQYVLSAERLHADDTPIVVSAPSTGKTKQARLWTYVRDDRPMGSHKHLRYGLLTQLTARYPPTEAPKRLYGQSAS